MVLHIKSFQLNAIGIYELKRICIVTYNTNTITAIKPKAII